MSSYADSALSKSAQEKINVITNMAKQGTLDWKTANSLANNVDRKSVV